MDDLRFFFGTFLLICGCLILLLEKNRLGPLSKRKVLSPLRLQSGHEALRWLAGLFLSLIGLFLTLQS